jgi:hypothetical protein
MKALIVATRSGLLTFASPVKIAESSAKKFAEDLLVYRGSKSSSHRDNGW